MCVSKDTKTLLASKVFTGWHLTKASWFDACSKGFTPHVRALNFAQIYKFADPGIMHIDDG